MVLERVISGRKNSMYKYSVAVGSMALRETEKRSKCLGVRELLGATEEFKAEKDVNRFRFWQGRSGCIVGCGSLEDQAGYGQTSHQAISEETAQKGWTEVAVAEMERMDKYKDNYEVKITRG